RKWIAYDIRSREELASPVIVVEQDQMKRAAASQRYDAVYLPALAPSWEALPQIRQIIGEGRHETVACIEVGARALLVDAMAVVGLGRIRNIVLPIRSIVDRVRPCVVDR